jgi:uncharacterized protein YdhG (YjbR/CyaY superfamily)
MPKIKVSTIDEYINAAPVAAQPTLREIRAILKQVAPNAKETIKWGYPVFEEKRILFSISAFKNHLNFMPTGSSLDPFRSKLAAYKTGKDTVQFTYDKPLPVSLIKEIAAHRLQDVMENDAKWMY